MNRKTFTLFLASFLMTGLASAQAVQIEDADEFPGELTGGESFDLGLNYSVNSPSEVPLALEFDAFYNGSEVPVEAFDLSVEGYDDACEGFRCNLNDTEDDGGVELQVDSNPRLQPGSFSFEVDLLSAVGFGEEVESVNITRGETQEVQGQRSSVSIQSEVNGSANVTELEFIGAGLPSTNSEFLGGVEVDIKDENGSDSGDRSSGTVRIEFDEDEVDNLETDSIAIHLYNESTNEWEQLDSDVGDGFVEAEVDHFSVYSAFGEEEDSGGSTFDVGGSDGSETVVETEDDTEEDPETSNEDDETQDEQQNEDETEQEPDQQIEREDTDDSEEPPSQSLTGQFAETASNPLTILVALLALVGAYAVYTDRHEKVVQSIRS